MRLRSLLRGDGESTALLVHGMMGSAESWWRISDALVAEGYRVAAIDLPGHGLSYRDRNASVESVANDLAETASSLNIGGVRVAIGHSFGGLVLAAASQQLAAETFVFVDSPVRARGGYELEATRREYEQARAIRTAEHLRRRGEFTERDISVEVAAAERFDPATAAAIAAGPGGKWYPPAGSLVIRSDPSDYVSPSVEEELRARGVDVVGIPGAPHTIWRTHFDEFWNVILAVLAK